MTPRPPRGRADPAALPDDRFLRRQRALRLVTRGRRTGREHTVELWFASELAGSLRIYLMAYARRHGRGTDWYRNLRRAGEGMVLVGGRRYRVRWEPPGEAAAAVEAITRKFALLNVSVGPRRISPTPTAMIDSQISAQRVCP